MQMRKNTREGEDRKIEKVKLLIKTFFFKIFGTHKYNLKHLRNSQLSSIVWINWNFILIEQKIKFSVTVFS